MMFLSKLTLLRVREDSAKICIHQYQLVASCIEEKLSRRFNKRLKILI